MMNVFYTNKCPVQSAKEHSYVHVVKMLSEYVQLMSTAHKLVDGVDKGFKATHPHHPSCVWVRQSKAHYDWVWQCAKALSDIYTQRTGKIHKSSLELKVLADSPVGVKLVTFSKPPVAAPDKFKAMAIWYDTETAYQAYLNEKFVEWKNRDKPMKVEFPCGVPSWYKEIV